MAVELAHAPAVVVEVFVVLRVDSADFAVCTVLVKQRRIEKLRKEIERFRKVAAKQCQQRTTDRARKKETSRSNLGATSK